MFWKFTCYNKDTWEAPHQMTLIEAVELFLRETQYSQWDIHFVENLH